MGSLVRGQLPRFLFFEMDRVHVVGVSNVPVAYLIMSLYCLHVGCGGVGGPLVKFSGFLGWSHAWAISVM